MATIFPKFASYPQNLGESAVAASPFLNIKASDLMPNMAVFFTGQ